MKIKTIVLLVLTVSTLSFAQESKNTIDPACKKIVELQKTLKSSSEPDKVLFRMGKIANEVQDVSPDQFRKNSDYKNICHLKIIKSANFGDFTSYDGYHFKKILEKYPRSKLADDAAYELIYVINDDVYNYSDTRIERKKLLQFVKKYPNSNLAKTAEKRIKAIDYDIEHGVPTIMD